MGARPFIHFSFVGRSYHFGPRAAQTFDQVTSNDRREGEVWGQDARSNEDMILEHANSASSRVRRTYLWRKDGNENRRSC